MNRHEIQEQAKRLAKYIPLDQLQKWLQDKQNELDILSTAVVIRYKKERYEAHKEQEAATK